jgi:tetratricopeptide (TPR) repeat protein
MEAMGAVSQPPRLALIGGLLAEGAQAEVLEALDAGAGLGQLIDGLLRAWTQLAMGRMSEALAAFDALAAVPGLEASALYHKALALAHVGDAEGAEAILSGATDGAVRLTARGVFALAQILSQLDRQDEALALLDRVFGEDADPTLAAMRSALSEGAVLPFDIITSPRDGQAEVFHDIAAALRGEAEDSFTLLLARVAQALRPDHVPATLMTAQLLVALQQYDLAVAAFATVSPEAPQFHMAELGRAEALRASGDTDAARAVLEALAESHGDIAMVHITLGDLLRRERAFDEASRAYDRALELLGEPQPQHWVVWYTRAITHERESRWEQAEADFRKALELSPDEPHVLNYLGYSLVERRENLDEALEMIRRAVAGEPDNGYIVDSLGWVYYRLGRHDEALVHMERAVELMPTDAILNDHLGDVYWALGRKREARFQWRRALSFGPADDLDMDRIRRKLEVGLDQVLIEEGAEPHHAAGSATGAATGSGGHAN